jgi:hypothetical protein
VTVYNPSFKYVYTGFCCVLVPPSPKFQSHAVGLLLDKSVKLTVKSSTPKSGDARKFAEGGNIGGLVEKQSGM